MEKKEVSATGYSGDSVIGAQAAALATEESLITGAWPKNWIIQPKNLVPQVGITILVDLYQVETQKHPQTCQRGTIVNSTPGSNFHSAEEKERINWMGQLH